MALDNHIDGASSELDPRTDQLVEQLVRKALKRGVPLSVSRGELRPFASGTRAAFVGTLTLTPTLRSVVVKIDSAPVTAEARHLQRTADDHRLPESFRKMLPAVYAADSIGGDSPLHGYLMEDLSGSHETLSAYLVDPDRGQQAGAIVDALWATLEEAYRCSRSSAVVPNVEQLYIDKIVPGLELAVAAEPRISQDRPIRVHTGTERVDLPPWGEVIAAARDVAARCTPPFATFTHGDLHGWNVLVRPNGDGFDLRLIDPSEGVHDYIQDVGRIATSLRYIAAADGDGLAVPPRLTTAGDASEITYQIRPPRHPLMEAEARLVTLTNAFADRYCDRTWRTRLQLATGSTLLALLPNLASRDERWRRLALVAFAEGLRTLWSAIR
jgi:phosphotransferase family enzyme